VRLHGEWVPLSFAIIERIVEQPLDRDAVRALPLNLLLTRQTELAGKIVEHPCNPRRRASGRSRRQIYVAVVRRVLDREHVTICLGHEGPPTHRVLPVGELARFPSLRIQLMQLAVHAHVGDEEDC
jgi:hypothetical protein